MLLPIWVLIESRSRAPMLDLKIFKNRLFAAASAASFINGLARFALMFLFVFYFQGAQSNTPIEAGIKLIPLALGMLVASPLAGIYADRHGSRTLAALGMLVSAAGLAGMTTLGVHTPYWQSGRVAADRRRRLGHVQQPQHRRDDGHRPRPAARHRRGRAHAAAEHRRRAVDRVRAGDRHLGGAESDAVRGLLRPHQGALRSEARAVHRQHARRAVGARRDLADRGRASACCARATSEAESATLSFEEHRLGARHACRASRTDMSEASSATEPSLRIGDVARLVGTTPRTIRYYEEIGLLPAAPARPPASTACTPTTEVERLREVMRLKDLLGVSLEELKTLLAAEEARAAVRAQLRREDVDPERRRELLSEALGHIDRQLELVRAPRRELARLEARAVRDAQARAPQAARAGRGRVSTGHSRGARDLGH